MTTVAMYQHDDDVEWGWDSLTTGPNEAAVLMLPKVFAKGGVVYGIAGDALAINVLLTREMPVYDGTDPHRWAMIILRPALQQLVDEEPSLWDQEEVRPNFHLLISVGGVGFWTDRTFAPYRAVEGIEAIGSGGDYAKGALTAGASMIDSIQAASEIDPNTGGPLYACFASKLIEAAQEAESRELADLELHTGPMFHMVFGTEDD